MKRNLIYHLYPQGCWEKNLEWLRKYADVFTGERICALAWDESCGPWEEVKVKAQDLFNCFLICDNDPELRETATLELLLSTLKILAQQPSITFYGHSKAITHDKDKAPEKRACEIWARLCYEKNLEDMDRVEDMLREFSVVGCFKKHGPQRPLPSRAKWHYSGTFYWFKTEDLFKRDYTQAIRKTRYGAEGFPGILWDTTESGVLFCDKPGNLYNYAYISQLLRTL